MSYMRFKRKKTVKIHTKKFHHSSLWFNIIPKSQGDWLLYVSHTVRGPKVDNGTLLAVKSHTIRPAPILYFIKKTLSYRSSRWQVHRSNEKVTVISKKNRVNMGDLSEISVYERGFSSSTSRSLR